LEIAVWWYVFVNLQAFLGGWFFGFVCFWNWTEECGIIFFPSEFCFSSNEEGRGVMMMTMMMMQEMGRGNW
jgi:hypothetical protein